MERWHIVIFNKQGNSEDDVKLRNSKGKNTTQAINLMLWNKTIIKERKKIIYESIVKAITTNSAEVWDIS